MKLNWRKPVYSSYASLRGYQFHRFQSHYRREFQSVSAGQIRSNAMARLLRHCRALVPYYAEMFTKTGLNKDDFANPFEALRRLPVLTKDIIRSQSGKLHSRDLMGRQWQVNTSGGSTGEPIQLVQDSEYDDQSKATTLELFSRLGYELGQPLVRLWGSERDLLGGTRSFKAQFFNWLTNTTWMNAFDMSPAQMRRHVVTLNRVRPCLVLAYAQAAYELARFVEREGLSLEPQQAVVTSAGTLYSFMRKKISEVFQCPVYNLYGSREVSDVACELPGMEGLWVPPWNAFIEVLDDDGAAVPAGEEGNVVVTSLSNYAMPLLRYWIGDRGALLDGETPRGSSAQVLKHVSGRNVDMFRTQEQKLIDGEFFTHLLYFRPWVAKFQVVQRSLDEVLFKVVKTNQEPPRCDLDEIISKARAVMGPACRVAFEFLAHLPAHPSGKYRYTICELPA
jgi:phenylacetate-CoA ligase